MLFTQNVSTAHDYFCGNDARVPMVESQWPIVQLVSSGLYRFKTYVAKYGTYVLMQNSDKRGA